MRCLWRDCGKHGSRIEHRCGFATAPQRNSLNCTSNLLGIYLPVQMEYDSITALHYAAYRPALHGPILAACLEEGSAFERGLDVGCGTGQSAIALAAYCERVIGVEPSAAMLGNALPHPKLTYLPHNGQDFDFEANTFDLIAFAGSLYYAKSQTLLDEVIRIGKDGSKIIVYDFDIPLEGILEKLGADLAARPESGYNHQADFSSLDQTNLKVEKRLNQSLSFEIAVADLAHLLLSIGAHYNLLAAALGRADLYDTLANKLFVLYTSGSLLVEAKTYATVYTIVKANNLC